MGTRGPIPKRSDESVARRSVTRLPSLGDGRGLRPPMIEEPHPVVETMWRALHDSPQRVFMQESDWAAVLGAMHNLDGYYKSPRRNSQLYAESMKVLSSVGVCEGDRRRMGFEVDRHDDVARPDVAAVLREKLEA